MSVSPALCIALLVSINTASKCRPITGDQSNFNAYILQHPYTPFIGVVTIEGKLHPNNAYEQRVAYDYLKFLKEGDQDKTEPILEVVTQVGRGENQHAVEIRGILNGTTFPTSDSSKKQFIINPEADDVGDFWVYRDNNVVLQISDIGSASLGHYSVFAGTPGDPNSRFTFNYGSDENWNKFAGLPLVFTRRVKNIDKKGVLTYFNISVCEDPQPVLSDDTSYQIIRADLGKTYTLSCSGSGAPFLASVWRDENGKEIDGHSENVFINKNSEQHIESSLVISDFEDKDAGNYTCKIFNKNFNESSVEKIVTLRHIVIESAPNSTYSLTENHNHIIQFNWTIRGCDLLDVTLDCKSESGSRVDFYRKPLTSPTKLVYINNTMEFLDGQGVPAVLSCALLNGYELLDHRAIMIVEENPGNSTENTDESPSEQTSDPATCSGTFQNLAFIISFVFNVVSIAIIIATMIAIIKFPQRANKIVSFAQNVFRSKINRTNRNYDPVPNVKFEDTEMGVKEEKSIPTHNGHSLISGSCNESPRGKTSEENFSGKSEPKSKKPESSSRDSTEQLNNDGKNAKRPQKANVKQSKNDQKKTKHPRSGDAVYKELQYEKFPDEPRPVRYRGDSQVRSKKLVLNSDPGRGPHYPDDETGADDAQGQWTTSTRKNNKTHRITKQELIKQE